MNHASFIDKHNAKDRAAGIASALAIADKVFAPCRSELRVEARKISEELLEDIRHCKTTVHSYVALTLMLGVMASVRAENGSGNAQTYLLAIIDPLLRIACSPASDNPSLSSQYNRFQSD